MRKELLKITLVVLCVSFLAFLVIYTSQQSFLKAKETAQIPASYPNKSSPIFDEIKSIINKDARYKISEYKGHMYREDKSNIVEVSLDKSSSNQKIRVIPVDLSSSKDELNLLERFIFTNHGIAEKADQIVFSLGNKNIAQIAFSFYIDGVAEYEVFSAYIENDIGWIFNSTFELDQKYEGILSSKQSPIIDLQDFIENFKPTNSSRLKEGKSMKLKLNREIDTELIKLNHEFNKRYKSTF